MSFNEISQLLDNVPDDPSIQVEVFRRVAASARGIWEIDPDSDYLSVLAQKAGDAARVESKRIPLGESGILDFFCHVIVSTTGGPALSGGGGGGGGGGGPLVVQCLRIIGNTCADEDANREKVVASGCMPSIVNLLNHDEILAFVIPVLYNICVDYEPAQKAVYQAGINPKLISLISGPRLEHAASFMNYICKLLLFVAVQEPEENLVDPRTPLVLLSLAAAQPLPLDTEDFLGQTTAALPYLSISQFQRTFLESPGSVARLLKAFERVCSSFQSVELDPEDLAQLKQVRDSFVAALSDISAHPLFSNRCTLQSNEAKILQSWLSTPSVQLATGACQALGNIARSDDVCIYLVSSVGAHKPLIATLSDPSVTDAGFLHSILGFLKNLSIASSNKPLIGEAGIFETHVLPRLWDLSSQPQVQFDAVSLARLLVVGCPENVRRICSPLSDDTNSPAHERTKLRILMDLVKTSDHEPTVLESARAITAVCRVKHTTMHGSSAQSQTAAVGNGSGSGSAAGPSQPPHVPVAQPTTSAPTNGHRPETLFFLDASSTPRNPLQAFYAAHNEITGSMLILGTQTKFPVLRSEMLFVFALMARSEEGAAMVARSMHRFEFVGVIEEVITGEKIFPDDMAEGSGSSPESSRSDYESQNQTQKQISNVAGLDLSTPASALTPTTPNPNPTPAPHTTNPLLPPNPIPNPNPQQQPKKQIADVDRENALVLIAELLQRCPYELLPLPRRTFHRLLKGGGQQLLLQREQGQSQGQGQGGAGAGVTESHDAGDGRPTVD
ncbi:ARM repeat-containing protein [Xylariaceae sp. FL0255]|nr:ARM repeat-containing protein [Xylariaceae sp. FL0255]